MIIRRNNINNNNTRMLRSTGAFHHAFALLSELLETRGIIREMTYRFHNAVPFDSFRSTYAMELGIPSCRASSSVNKSLIKDGREGRTGGIPPSLPPSLPPLSLSLWRIFLNRSRVRGVFRRHRRHREAKPSLRKRGIPVMSRVSGKSYSSGDGMHSRSSM